MGKMTFHHFWHVLKQIFLLLLEKSTIGPPMEKILSTPLIAAIKYFERESFAKLHPFNLRRRNDKVGGLAFVDRTSS